MKLDWKRMQKTRSWKLGIWASWNRNLRQKETGGQTANMLQFGFFKYHGGLLSGLYMLLVALLW